MTVSEFYLALTNKIRSVLPVYHQSHHVTTKSPLRRMLARKREREGVKKAESSGKKAGGRERDASNRMVHF